MIALFITGIGFLFVFVMNYIWARQDKINEEEFKLLEDLKNFENKPSKEFITKEFIKSLEELKALDEICDGKDIEDVRIVCERSCPCLYLETPCSPNCTCRNQFSSHGCSNCCTYGSLDQRKEMAKHLDFLRQFYNERK